MRSREIRTIDWILLNCRLVSKAGFWVKSAAIKNELNSSNLLMGVAMEMRKICLFLELQGHTG